MKVLRSVQVTHHFMVLLELLEMLFVYQCKAQSPDASATNASSLNALLQDYSYRALVRPHTEIICNGTVPSNLTGIRIAAARLKSGSLRRRGMSYNEFGIPLSLIVKPYVKRLVLVYRNLGNWSSFYYSLPGYTFLTPVIELLAYDASNLSATNLLELHVLVLESPISISFTNVTTVPSGVIARCVWFGLNSLLEFQYLVSSNSCATYSLGHFSIVVNSSKIAASKSSNSRVRKIVGGLLTVVLFGLLVYCLTRVRKNRVAQMEQHAGVSLQTCKGRRHTNSCGLSNSNTAGS